MSDFSESWTKFKQTYKLVPIEDRPSLWCHMLVAPLLMTIAIVWSFGWPGALFCFAYFLRYGTQP